MKSVPAVLLSDMTNKYKRWTDVSMCAAIQIVEDGSSVSQVACAHGVPYTTLYDRMVGNVTCAMEPTLILDHTLTHAKRMICQLF